MTLSGKKEYEVPETSTVFLTCEQFICGSQDFPDSTIEDMNIIDLGWDTQDIIII